jgi:uncharacterized protein
MSARPVSNVRVGLIYFVGLLNLAFGGLFVALGLWILLAGADAVATLFQARQELGQAAAQLPADKQALKSFDDYVKLASQGLSGLILALASIVAGCSIVQGLPLVLVGAGVLLRQRWARVFALFFAVLALIEGSGCLLGKNSNPLVWLTGGVLVGYGVISFIALLGRGAGAFFARRDQAAPAEPVAGGRALAGAAGIMALLAVGVLAGGWYLSRPAPMGPPPVAQDGPKAKSTKPVVEVDDLKRPYDQRVAALADAIKRGQISRVEELLKNGAGVNDRDEKGETPLMKAVQSGYVDLCPLLINKGADLRAPDSDGNDVFLHAAARGKFEWFVRAIPFSGNNLGSYRAGPTHGGDWRTVLLEDTNHKKMTAAMLAAANGHLEDLQYIMMGMAAGKVGVGWLALTDKDGKTALDHARTNGHTAIVKLIEQHGKTEGASKKEEKPAVTDEQIAIFTRAIDAADFDALDRLTRSASDDVKRELVRRPDAEGKSALTHAAAKGDATVTMVVQQIIRQANLPGLVAVTDKRQRTALHYAAEAGHVETLKTLLELVSQGWRTYGGKPGDGSVHWFHCLGQRDSMGKTALDLAQAKQHKAAAELLQAHIDKFFLAPTYADMTVLEIAVLDRDRKLVQDLLKAGCPQMRPAKDYDKGRYTPLVLATVRGDLLMVKTLVDSLAGDRKKQEEYVNFRAGGAGSALDMAVQYHQAEIAALLRAHGAKEK